jgi:luciferase family oxidoreductase group 1
MTARVPALRVSVVDLSPVPPGGTAVDALANSVELAQQVEQLGYARYWVAEHHGDGRVIASSNPEVLVARIAAATSSIRVGSGTVLLNHYSPFKVAEVFATLHAMFPDRIDLGVGRANSPRPVVDTAMGTARFTATMGGEPAPALPGFGGWLEHQERVEEVLAWVEHSFPPGHPFAAIELLPGVEGGPQPWLLGSSSASAVIAARLGMRYCFAAFVNPIGAASAMRIYRQSFQPSGSPSGPQEPCAMLSVNVCCGESDTEGDRLRATIELFHRQRRGTCDPGTSLRSADDAVAALGEIPEPIDLGAGAWPQHISGGPERVRDILCLMAKECDADELMVQDMIADQSARLRSYELIANELC